MTRAFLCHSSVDKDYVRIVAKRLGRGQVAFDEFSFAPGQDFRDEIRRHLDRADVFVFFVSRASLDSVWCQFELDHAELKRMGGGIEAQLAIIVDPTVSYSELPAWMTNARAVRRTRPTQAARDVEQALFSVQAPEQRRPFVGRQDLSKTFTARLLGQEYEPRILVLTGLEGVGRRSHLSRVSQDVLDLPTGPHVLLGETAGLEDLFVRLLDELADLRDREELARNLTAFQALSDAEQALEVATQLGELARAGTVPVLVDAGALMERDTGEYRPTWVTLFDSYTRLFPDQYLALVQRRVPAVRDLPFGSKFLVQRVPPLADLDVRVLLGQLLRRVGVPFDAAEVEELAEFTSGYPPSAYFAATQASEYGMAALLADRSALVDFKAHRFSRFLDGLSLEEHEWLVLRYLAGETAVPLAAVGLVAECDEAETAKMLRRLIDLSLVLVVDGDYALSPPISDAVVRARGLLAPEWYEGLLPRVQAAFWDDDGPVPTLPLIDLTLRALLRSGADTNQYSDVLRVSTIHDIASESYHRSAWDDAVEFGRRAEEIYEARGESRRLYEIQEVLVKALSQLERYEDAESVLSDMEAAGARRTWYLRSFVYRKQRQMRQAADALASALQVGDRSNSVYRDYADVLLRLGEPERARQMIQVVLDRDPDNVFVLDLVARIEIEGDSRQRAETALRALERSDLEGRFIHHRRATFFQKSGQPELALPEAQEAMKAQDRRSTFEVYAVLADVLIELGRFEEFDELMNDLDKNFRNSRRDVRAGLRCKALTRRGRWREANTMWEQLREKALPVHRALLAAILEVKSSDMTVLLADRTEAAREAERLRNDLAEPRVYFIDDDVEADPEEPDPV